MGADFILHRACEPKRQLGGGDPLRGTQELLAMLKAESRVNAIAAMMQREGRDPDTASIEVQVRTASGVESRAVTLAEMRAEAKPLTAFSSHCARCSACVLSDRFGCFGYLNYPLTVALERWIVERIQPADTLGGHLLLQAIQDFGYDGRAMAGWRQRRDLTESERPLETIVARKWLGKTRVTVDQVYQAIFMAGTELGASHCMMILMWLGALRVHGAVPGPGSSGDPTPLVALTQATTPEQRQEVGQLDVGPPSDDRAVAGFQRLLHAMYAAWQFDEPLLMDG